MTTTASQLPPLVTFSSSSSSADSELDWGHTAISIEELESTALSTDSEHG